MCTFNLFRIYRLCINSMNLKDNISYFCQPMLNNVHRKLSAVKFILTKAQSRISIVIVFKDQIFIFSRFFFYCRRKLDGRMGGKNNFTHFQAAKVRFQK